MNEIWKRVSSVGLVFVLVASLLMSFPLISAAPPDKCEPWPECKGGGGEDPPADPAIAYFWQGEIKVMNTDGSNQATIYEGDFHTTGLSWSPDGSSLAFSVFGTPQGDFSLWRIDIEVVDGAPQGMNAQRLAGPEDCNACTGPAWSPVGGEIAIGAGVGVFPSYVTVVPDTGGPAQVIYTGPQETTGCKEVTWSSDGSRLAFVEVDMTTGDKYIKVIERATGTVTHTLVEGMFDTIEGLEWGRQGSDELAFGGQSEGVGFSLYILDIATGALEQVRGGDQPSWSPDNSMMVFVTLGKGQPRIKTIDLGTGDVTTLANRGKLPDWRRF